MPRRLSKWSFPASLVPPRLSKWPFPASLVVPGASLVSPGCPSGPLLPPWCLPSCPKLSKWSFPASLVLPRLSTWSFPASLVLPAVEMVVSCLPGASHYVFPGPSRPKMTLDASRAFSSRLPASASRHLPGYSNSLLLLPGLFAQSPGVCGLFSCGAPDKVKFTFCRPFPGSPSAEQFLMANGPARGKSWGSRLLTMIFSSSLVGQLRTGGISRSCLRSIFMPRGGKPRAKRSTPRVNPGWSIPGLSLGQVEKQKRGLTSVGVSIKTY